MTPTKQDNRPRIEDEKNTPEKATRNEGVHHSHKWTQDDFLKDLQKATRRLDDESDSEPKRTSE